MSLGKLHQILLQIISINIILSVPSSSLYCRCAAMIPFKKFAVNTKLSHVIRRPSYNTLFSIMYHSTTDKDLSFGLTRTQMNKMKVGELREALEERNLDSKGTKKVLLERLREVIPSKNSGNKAQISSTSVKNSNSASNRTLKIQEYQQEVLDHEKIILSPTSVYVLQFDGGSRVSFYMNMKVSRT